MKEVFSFHLIVVLLLLVITFWGQPFKDPASLAGEEEVRILHVRANGKGLSQLRIKKVMI